MALFPHPAGSKPATTILPIGILWGWSPELPTFEQPWQNTTGASIVGHGIRWVPIGWGDKGFSFRGIIEAPDLFRRT